MNRIFTLLTLLTIGIAAKGQGSSAFEFLYSISDDILIVQNVRERVVCQSLLQCTSYVDADLVELLKVKRLSPSEKTIHFVRTVSCDEKGSVSNKLLLDKNEKYIVFFSNSPGYDTIHKVEVYNLSDNVLGIQRYDERIVKYLRGRR